MNQTYFVLSHLPQSVEKYRQVDVIVQIGGTNHPTDRIALGAVVHADGQVTSHVILAKKSRRDLSTTPGAWKTRAVESKAYALCAHLLELSLTRVSAKLASMPTSGSPTCICIITDVKVIRSHERVRTTQAIGLARKVRILRVLSSLQDQSRI